MKSLAPLLFLIASLNAVAGNTKVLIIEGLSNHDWKHRVRIVQAILDADGSFDVTLSVAPAKAGDPAWDQWRPEFSDYDVILSGYNNLGGGPRWPESVEKAFENYVREGGGFVAYHEANNSFKNWQAYNEMIGLGWRKAGFGEAVVVEADGLLTVVPTGEGGNTGHGKRLDVEVKRLGDHPLHAGLPRSWMAADIEIYRYARGPNKNLRVLSHALDPSSRLRFPIEWTVNYGDGRIFVSTYGHTWKNQAEPKGMRCAAFQSILVRALKWCAGDPVPSTAPADFPGPGTISLRPHAERADE